MPPWWNTPAGRYLLAWEQTQLDRAVTDIFGFHALQLGVPAVDGLRANRMPHRWVASPSLQPPGPVVAPPPSDGSISTLSPEQPVALHCEFDALPFPNQSLDLVVMPHALELASDPHQALREVERVLVPEGRCVIVGLNPASLWGLRLRMGRAGQRLGLGEGSGFAPGRDTIGYWRLRDWLRLLSFEVERGRFGCWRPPARTQPWIERFGWMEKAGDRWWPVFGALYMLVAVKRVRGMRLVGLARREKTAPAAAPAVVAQRKQETVEAE